ncbi:MAG: hypothetical protein NTZ26_00440 [Candidatus Aminicenantes bacterium]|nr:hypothetical protein [Candidatus Aminicenantes bacterium]
MKRREALKTLPLAAAGWTLSARVAGAGPARAAAPPLRAEVKAFHGRPVLHLNGKPVFPAISWVSGPRPDGWDFARQARMNRETGIHVYAFDVGKGVEWIGPGTSPQNPYDFSTLAARFGRVLDADPEALFHLRIYLETGHDDWWERANPGECEILSDGRRNGQSFASTVWRQQVRDFLTAYAAALKKAGLAERVLAYQVGAGHTGEWVKGESSMHAPCGDYSEPMRRHFRAWLRRTYAEDAAAFRLAWNDPRASFETAEVPGAEAQLAAGGYIFRDPRTERAVIDYFQCLAELCADAVIDFCRAAKTASGGTKLAGAFYGYVMDLAWNGGFFRERPDSDYSTYQRSGHLGLHRVLEDPAVDFLVSPYSYGYRGIGGDGPSMLPAESARLHDKLVLIEDDTRTHVDAEDPHYGRAATLAESTAILRRNLAQDLTHGQGAWWAAWKIDPIKEPAFLEMLRGFRGLGEFALELDLAPSADVAVLLDDESFFYETCRYNLDIPLIFQQRLWGLPKMGTPFDTYLLNDFIGGRTKPYKLLVFLNPFRLDAGRRRALAARLAGSGSTALWIYAPGYIRDDCSTDHMRELTGIRFGLGEQPWGPLVHITDGAHPITAGLPQDLVWGTNAKLAPLFHVDDPEARVLGQVVYSQGDCKPGFAVKPQAGWTSVYSAAPNLPAPVLRGIARFAGAHIYGEDGDVLYATPQLLGLHTITGGRRTIRLRGPVEIVYDLFARRVVAQNAAGFEIETAPASTALFYMGSAGLLEKLPRA